MRRFLVSPDLASAALIGLGALLRLHLLRGREWVPTTDDTYITVRIAEKLVSGEGFVFNAGERVLATTTPLWGAMIAGASTVLPSIAAVMVLSFLCYGISAFLLDRLLGQSLATPYRLIAIGIYAFYYPFVSNAISGMETSLFLTLALAAFAVIQVRKPWAFFLGGVSVLARPEGVLVLVILGVVTVWENRHAISRGRFVSTVTWQVLPAIAVVLLWSAVAAAYYGSPLPHSMVAKSSFYQESLDVSMTAARLVEILQVFSGLRAPTSLTSPLVAWGAYIAWVAAFVLYCAGIIMLMRAGRLGLLAFCSYYLFQSVFYWIGGGLIDSNWYAVPPSLAFFVAAVAALHFLHTGYRYQWRRQMSAAVAAATIGVSVMSHAVMAPVEKEIKLDFDGRLKSTAEAIRQDAPRRFGTHITPSLAVGDIGYIGYALPAFHVYDLWGLATPAVLSYKETPSYLVPFLRDHAAHYVIVSERSYSTNQPLLLGYRGRLFGSEADREWFMRSYELVYTSPKVTFRRFDGTQYLVFALRRESDVAG